MVFSKLYSIYDHQLYLSLALLFLLPPSCMVASIGETANKFTFLTSFSTTIPSNNQQNLLLSVNIFNNTEMDHSTETNSVINNNARDRSPQIHKNWSKSSSMSSTVSSKNLFYLLFFFSIDNNKV